MSGNQEKYTIEPIPRMRRFSIDSGYLGRRKHIVHGLIEVDVTDARTLIQSHADQTGIKYSFTAFLIYCLSRAIEKNPHLHAYRNWKGQLVIFEDVNINTMVEIERDGRRIPIPLQFKAANRKSLADIHHEIRAAQTKPRQTRESKFMDWFLYLPAFIRRMFYWFVMRVPNRFREVSSSVMVTAVGMFGKGGGWAITMPNFTLTVAVGGISRKPGVIGDQIAIRDYLNLTISVDHDIVDGGPIVRFVNHFQELVESGAGLSEAMSGTHKPHE